VITQSLNLSVLVLLAVQEMLKYPPGPAKSADSTEDVDTDLEPNYDVPVNVSTPSHR